MVLLRAIYGDVHPNWDSGWLCRPADLVSGKSSPALAAIHAGLVAHRGHADFVGVKRLPRCDYYVSGKPGFLVEYDESQHFTALRAVSLSEMPAHTVAFDVARWSRLCMKINARDNDPVYRDEQRAWYDVLRDLLPADHGLGPTSRLYDTEIAFCALDAANVAHRTAFVELLGRP